jgi:hypothetical protein
VLDAACQCRDNRYDERAAFEAVLALAASLGVGPGDARRILRRAYSRNPREPWSAPVLVGIDAPPEATA